MSTCFFNPVMICGVGEADHRERVKRQDQPDTEGVKPDAGLGLAEQAESGRRPVIHPGIEASGGHGQGRANPGAGIGEMRWRNFSDRKKKHADIDGCRGFPYNVSMNSEAIKAVPAENGGFSLSAGQSANNLRCFSSALHIPGHPASAMLSAWRSRKNHVS